MKKYKIWIEIEELDEEADNYRDLEDPISVGGEFDTEEDARAFRDLLSDIEYQ